MAFCYEGCQEILDKYLWQCGISEVVINQLNLKKKEEEEDP